MHETSLIKYTLDAVERSAAQNGIKRVTDIRMVVGELKMAFDDQLQLAFRIMKGNDPLFEDAVLYVEWRPLTLRCEECGHVYPSDPREMGRSSCAKCGSDRFTIETGQELYIDSYGGE